MAFAVKLINISAAFYFFLLLALQLRSADHWTWCLCWQYHLQLCRMSEKRWQAQENANDDDGVGAAGVADVDVVVDGALLSIWFFFWLPPSSPSLPHPLHTHVSVAKFKQLLPANAFNGKTSFVAPNGAVAKVSFCLVSFRFCFGFFLSLLFASSNIHWVWVKGRCRGWGRGCCWCRHAAISLADSAPSPGQLHCHSHTESRPCRAYGARARARSSSHLNAHIISNLCS